MKFSLDQASFMREIALLQGVIEKKSTFPILHHVLLTVTEEGRVTMVATDLEVGFRSEVAATVTAPGRAAVPARRLYEVLRRLPSGTLSIRLEGSAFHIECDRIKYKLTTQEPDQFPAVRTREGSPQAVVASDLLAEMIKMILFAITTDDPRYTLGGAQWEFSDDQLTMVATDGHRLSISSRPAQQVGKDFPVVLVPRTALRELQRLAADHEGDVYLWANSGSLIALVGHREITTTLQENHRFPDYRRVIPQNNDKVFEIGTQAMRDAVDRASVLRDEETKLVRLELGENLLRVMAVNDKFGSAQEEVNLNYAGGAIEIGFNAQYLLDFLNNVGTEQVRVLLGEAMGQGLFEPVRPAEDRRHDRYVVMPMAL
jgi:DNA polymerase-3 subunit beta